MLLPLHAMLLLPALIIFQFFDAAISLIRCRRCRRSPVAIRLLMLDCLCHIMPLIARHMLVTIAAFRYRHAAYLLTIPSLCCALRAGRLPREHVICRIRAAIMPPCCRFRRHGARYGASRH